MSAIHALTAAALALGAVTPRLHADYLGEQRAVIEGLANPTAGDLVFYRWQSKASGDALLKAGTYSEDLHARFMSMSADSPTLQAGRGLYVAENPFSSSRYMNGDDEGSLIEVHVKKGTRFMDVNDPATDRRISGAKLLTDEVLQLDAPVAIKYHSRNGWWVLKERAGVSFARFDGSRFDPGRLAEFYDKLATPKAKAIFTREVSAHVRRTLETSADPGDLTKYARLMTPADVEKARAYLFHSPPTECGAGGTLRILEKMASP